MSSCVVERRTQLRELGDALERHADRTDVIATTLITHDTDYEVVLEATVDSTRAGLPPKGSELVAEHDGTVVDVSMQGVDHRGGYPTVWVVIE